MTIKALPVRLSRVPFSTNKHDPAYWPVGLTVNEQLQLLCAVSPDRGGAFGVLVDFALREEWAKLDRDAIMRLLDASEDCTPHVWKCDAPEVTKPKGRS